MARRLAYPDAMLEARDLVVVRDGDRKVLDGASLRLEAGELVELEGPSGSGKSTLLWALARLIPKRAGAVTLDGKASEELEVREWRRRVALLLQRPALPALTVRADLMLPFTLALRMSPESVPPPGEGELLEGLSALGLEDVELDRPSSELSVGQAGRVAFLRAILTRPDHLLLDEPTAALDSASARQLHVAIDAFVAGGGSVLLVSHHDHGATRGRLLRLEDGRIREGSP